MTEHKFTDEEIKKRLADWKYNLCVSCETDDCEHCVAHLLWQSLDLIKRQQAKIEMLKKDRYLYKDGVLELLPRTDLEEIKSEAIKEFAERLKEKGAYNSFNELIIFEDMVDNLVKEMTEKEKNND